METLKEKELKVIVSLQIFLKELYEKEGWDKYNSFVDSNFLLEELGEVGELMMVDNPALKNKTKLKEELGDILGALLSIGNRYELSLKHWNDLDFENVDISFKRLVKDLGMMAREVRRVEIGRHSHNEKEAHLNSPEHFKKIWMDAIISLFKLAKNIWLTPEEVAKYHYQKMNRKYSVTS